MELQALLSGSAAPLSILLLLPDYVRAAAAMIFVIGVMVLVHEWGHFVVARLFKVRVDIFSVGFGPRLTGWRRGPTDYRISALPIGGYVKMAGDTPEESRTGSPDEFLSKPRWQRALIILAGPTMNIVSAAVFYFAIFYGYGIPQAAFLHQPPVLAGVLKDSPAAKAGLQAGDRLVEVNHTATATWQDVGKALDKLNSTNEVDVVYERGGQRYPVVSRGNPDARESLRPALLLGFPNAPIELDTVVPGKPADRAGLKVDDRIVSVDGSPIVSVDQFLEAIQGSGGKTLQITLLRNGKELTIPVAPREDASVGTEKAWRIGVIPVAADIHYHRLSLGESLSLAGTQTVGLTGQIFVIVAQLASGRASIRDVAGPVGIMQYSGEAAKRGFYALAFLTAGISLNLAVLNLLPIPILDGGHILLLGLEGIRRRDFSQVVRERFLQVGMVFILLLIAIVMYNDIRNLIPAKWLG
ncbi:MAG TPA: RIP metalloprotease RseP [Candidatus Acidoferrales bacterium]|nr:RIP metalloprotease RseP [Candidatus Acidoferrales bacterium]